MMPASTAVVRDARGKWVGSGNPAGRPKSEFDLAAEARKYTPEGLQKLVEIIRTTDSHEVALRAIALLFDRGHGRPMQPIADSTEAGVSLQLMHLVATQQVAEQLEREWSARRTNGSGREPEPPVIDFSQPALE